MMDLNSVEKKIASTGFLDVEIDPALDLVKEIDRLKKEKNAIILAHFYQEAAIQDIADYVGDSLGLSQEAAKADVDIIVFAGVHFMAETAKIINPHKKVLLPDLKAGCSLAESCPPGAFKKYLDEHPGHVVVSYINCTIDIKAMSDIICTSSNAVKVIESIPEDQPIIFAPDKNLGKYIIQQTGRDMLLWNGACQVHEVFTVDKVLEIKKKHPDAKVIAHPECGHLVLEVADFIGSTNKLLSYAVNDPAKEFIVVTEAGILHQMKEDCPGKKFIPAPPVYYTDCACSECPYMKLNTLEKLYLCLKYEQPEITVPEAMRLKAYKPIEKMLDISAKAV